MAALLGTGFGSDDGSVPAELAAVLARRAEGRASIRDVVGVLATQRVLVPLLEVDAGRLDSDDADPCAGQDRAVAAVSLRTSEGAVGLAFTGLAPLAAWDPRARPMPVEARRAAGAVLAEQGVALLVDAGSPWACRIDGIALARLASGGDWPQPWADPAVQQAVLAELAPVLASGEVQVRLADPAAGESGTTPSPGLVVEIRFAGGLADDVVKTRASVVARRLSGSVSLRQAFDGTLAVRVLG